MTTSASVATALGELVGQEIRWIQPRVLETDYLLRWQDLTLGTMRFRSCLSTRARVESEGGCWTFERTGVLTTQVLIRRREAEASAGVFRSTAWAAGGCLELPDGSSLFVSSNFWSTEFAIRTEAGEPLVTYRRIPGLLRLASTVEIHPGAGGRAELPWLVAFGWYWMILQHRDAAIVAA